jgi:sterol desaturase/sphingolipid hydroxylase (fatty acid hydroxylase superfamily)
VWLAGLAAAFAVLVRLMPCNPGMYWWNDLRAVAADFMYWFVVPLFARLSRMLLLVAGVALLFGGGEPQYGPLRDLPLWQQCLAILLIQDVILYWIHRAFHTAPVWKFHAVHHSPKVLDWTSTVRFHPVNVLLEFTVADVAVLLMGFSPQALVILAPINSVYSAMVHANLNWTFGPLRHVLASPVFHRWHHTTEEEGLDKNFASTFPFLDLIFGTYYMPPGKRPAQFGTGDPSFPEGFWAQFLYPFQPEAPAGKTAGARRRAAAAIVLAALAAASLVVAGVYYRSRTAERDGQPDRAQEALTPQPEQAGAAPQVISVRPAAPAAPPANGPAEAPVATAVALSADGRLLVLGHGEGTVKVCDAATGGERLTLAGHRARVNSVAISGDGRCIVSGCAAGVVKVWDAATGKEKLTLTGHRGPVLSVAVSGDGRRAVSGGADGSVKVWDATSGREQFSLTGDTDAFLSVAVSANGNRVAVADFRAAKVWDARTGREERALEGHREMVFCVAISPDGRRVVSGSVDGTAKVWDAQAGREEFTLAGHKGSVVCLAVSGDGRHVVSGGNDGAVKVWDIQAGREELTFPGPADPITGVAVSGDGRRIVARARNGTVQLWDAHERGDSSLSRRDGEE